jgi:hypothetical protein
MNTIKKINILFLYKMYIKNETRFSFCHYIHLMIANLVAAYEAEFLSFLS